MSALEETKTGKQHLGAPKPGHKSGHKSIAVLSGEPRPAARAPGWSSQVSVQRLLPGEEGSRAAGTSAISCLRMRWDSSVVMSPHPEGRCEFPRNYRVSGVLGVCMGSGWLITSSARPILGRPCTDYCLSLPGAGVSGMRYPTPNPFQALVCAEKTGEL